MIEAIDQILYGQNVVYEVKGKNIIVQKGQPRPKEVKDSKKRKITGVVNDQNGEPIIGATVKEKAGVNGTATDLDAKFALEVFFKRNLLKDRFSMQSPQAISINKIHRLGFYEF